MYHIHCLNKISPKGTALLTDNYAITDDRNQADGVLVRSADMHNVALPESLLAVARAGAGVNNIPLDRCSETGIAVFMMAVAAFLCLMMRAMVMFFTHKRISVQTVVQSSLFV